MEFLQDYERPDLEGPVLLFAFAGWADASQSATHALHYLVGRLGAAKFTSVDPEEFYDFTQTRPHSGYDGEGNRTIIWPTNDFYSWKGGPNSSDLVIYVGTEPSLRWRTFTRQIVSVAKDLSVSKVIHVGALLDAVPHTREPRITGSATRRTSQERRSDSEVRRSGYSGPTGIAAVLGDAIRREGFPFVSLWGHSPHYLHVSPNPKVSLSLVQAMENVLQVDIDVEQLRSQGSNFDRRVAQALANEPEINEYILKLEAQYDHRMFESRSRNLAMPEPEEAVEDMEAFLKQIRDESSPNQGS
jgi:proteasome assembly chaperone (PAC2) family protein